MRRDLFDRAIPSGSGMGSGEVCAVMPPGSDLKSVA